jgi:hypothetical protein
MDPRYKSRAQPADSVAIHIFNTNLCKRVGVDARSSNRATRFDANRIPSPFGAGARDRLGSLEGREL